MKANNDPIVWNKCMFCGKEIYSKTYMPFQVDVHDVSNDEGKIILFGYSHKLCKNYFLLKINELCKDLAQYPKLERKENKNDIQ